MKFNRKLLEEETLQKIKEVNDEAGYRSYLEVPEMVNIVASIMEEKMKVFHDSDAELIKSLRDYINTVEEENEQLEQIINDTLRALPVGSISRHTPESIPERVQDWVKEAVEECMLREQWEACADNLIDYAHEFVAHLSLWGKGYGRYDKDIKLAEDAIDVYNKLKNSEPEENIKSSADQPAWKSWNWPMYTPFTPKK